MKLLPRCVLPGLGAPLILSVLLLATPGCRRHATRAASTLTEGDRALLDRYEDVRAGLADDDLRATKRAGTALNALLKKAPHSDPELLSATETIGGAAALDRARTAFEPLSASMVKLADGVEGYFIFDTPIPAGAQWIQRSDVTGNPYTGKAMHDVGTLQK